MKNHLASHVILTRGSPNLLEWVKGHKYRNYPTLDDIGAAATSAGMLKKIVSVKDDEARELCMEIFGLLEGANKSVVQCHEELDTLDAALTKISKSFDNSHAAMRKELK